MSMIYDLDSTDGLDQLFADAGMDASGLRGERVLYSVKGEKRQARYDDSDD